MDDGALTAARRGDASCCAVQRVGLILGPVVAGAVAMGVYAATIMPEVGWADSAELALQAYQLGVTHPPGYPVHTWLGKVFTLLFAEPAVGTNWMSAVCTAGAVVLLGAMIARATRSVLACVLGPLVFAMSLRVWEMAVVTEAYNVNILFLAAALWLVLAWSRRPTMTGLVAAAACFGASMGSYLANFLLTPALVLLVFRKGQNKKRLLCSFVFLAVAGLVGAAVLSWSCFRCHVHPPLGTRFLPDSIRGALRYFSGAQYGTAELRGMSFYAGRLAEHGRIFAANFLYIGILPGLLGLVWHWRTRRDECITLGLVFLINVGYFTVYKASDYYTMVTPSYFVFAYWIVLGIQWLADLKRPRAMRLASAATVLLAAGLVWANLPDRLERAKGTPVTDFALASLAQFPTNAVVVAGWEKLPTLLYFQTTRGLRPDVTIIEREDTPLRYAHGTVDGYSKYIDKVISARPVVIDRIEKPIEGKYAVRPINENWSELTRKPNR